MFITVSGSIYSLNLFFLFECQNRLQTIKKYILIIKYMWMPDLVYSGAWTAFSCSFAL